MSCPHRIPTPRREVLKETEQIPPHIERELEALRHDVSKLQAFIERLKAEATRRLSG